MLLYAPAVWKVIATGAPVIVSVKSIYVLFVVLKFQGPPVVSILPSNIYGVTAVAVVGIETGLLIVAIGVLPNSCVTLVICISELGVVEDANITL